MSQNGLVVAILIASTAFAGYELMNWLHALQAPEELHVAFRNFQKRYSLTPKEHATRAERIRHDYMLEVESTFQRNGMCHHLEYISNSCNEVMTRKDIKENHPQFDVLLVINKYKYDLQAVCDDTRPGYAWLKINHRSRGLEKVLKFWNSFRNMFGDDLNVEPELQSGTLEKVLKYWNVFGYIFGGDLYIDPGETLNIFEGELQKLVNKSNRMKGKVKLSRHGSAIQMDVHPDSGFMFWGPCLCSIHFIPAYEVDGALYVSKPINGEISKGMAWRHSFSVQDKYNLHDGAKWVLLALTLTGNREPGLSFLSSHHFHTVLLHEMDAECDWSDPSLVLRFLGALTRLELSLDNGKLQNYFIPEINLLLPLSPSSMREVRDNIHRIRSSKDELMKILKLL